MWRVDLLLSEILFLRKGDIVYMLRNLLRTANQEVQMLTHAQNANGNMIS